MCKVTLSLTFSRNRMATTAYLRVSTLTQDLENQQLAILEYAIVSELSRLGPSLGQVIHIVHQLVKRKIRSPAIKESIHFEGKR
jgi:DNA invertase Pin-like site-specific DNA recombinase